MLRLRDVVFAFDIAEADHVLGEWLAAAADRPEDGWTRSELEAHMRTEHSTFTWLLEPMLERAGFEIREASYSANRVFAAYVCVKRYSARATGLRGRLPLPARLGRHQPDDRVRDAGGERDHRDDEERDADQSERRGHGP